MRRHGRRDSAPAPASHPGPSPEALDGSAPGPRPPAHTPSTPTAPDGNSLGCKSAALADDASAAPPPGAAGRDADEAVARVPSGRPPYSAFSRQTRICITTMMTVSSTISPMTANIYFPALNAVAADLGVSVSLVNLTMTAYMVLQGLSPTVLGDFGDMAGRRPAFAVAFSIYLVANVGLALQRSYAALVVLRCLQSAGSSGTLALAYAVVADMVASEERGVYMGIVGAGVNLGPTIGPVVGGILSRCLGWPAIFWFCAVFVFVWLVPWVLAVPETCRAVVGNGSVPPPRWNMTLLDFVRRRGVHQRPESAPRVCVRVPNPLRTLSVVFNKEEGLILLISASIYLNFILVSATLSTLFMHIYDYDDLEVGLCYLPYGVGCCLASVGQGYVVDWNFRRIARRRGVPVRPKRAADLTGFPVETARVQPVYPALVVGAAALIGWGWALHVEANVAVPLALLFIIGMLVPTSFSVLNTLIVDLNPEAPATAAAANNLVRCSFGAVGTALIDSMLKAMGRGWCFTFLALLMVACLVGLRVLETHGPRWRAERGNKAGGDDSQTASQEGGK